jgi:hypothetical protein
METENTCSGGFGFPKFLFTLTVLIFGFLVCVFVYVNKDSIFYKPAKEEPVSSSQKIVIVGVYDIDTIQATYIDLYRNSAHAWLRHQEGASKAVECLEKNGSIKSYLTHFRNNMNNIIDTETFLCLDPISKTYYAVIMIVEEGRRVGILVTAYEVIKRYANPNLFTAYMFENFGGEISKFVLKAGDIVVQWSR